MATFAIIPIGTIPKVDTALTGFGNKALRLPNGEWLVAYDGTSRQLSDALGVTDSEATSAIILNFSAYWGRASTDIWEWIKENGEA